MNSVKSVIEFFRSAQEAADAVKELQGAYQSETTRWEAQMAALNEKAVKLSPLCRRSAHNNPEVQRAVRDFHDEFLIVTRGADTKTKLNANGHFLLGFHYRIEAEYDDAVTEFEAATKLARQHRQQPPEALYSGIPAGTALNDWLTKLENICLFHAAILKANLGEYGPARVCFEEALAADPWDYESLSYIPEIMFLGGSVEFEAVVKSFTSAIDKVSRLPEERQHDFSKKKDSLLATLHLKFANCYMADSSDADYRTHRDLGKAEEHVRAALDSDKDSLFARLSLAQILWLTQRAQDEQERLFRAVFADARSIVTRVTEAKILMMYYYILLITSTLGRMPNENPGLYGMRIYELMPQLPKPKELRIFSPHSKTDLHVEAFAAEVQAFERDWSRIGERSAPALERAASASINEDPRPKPQTDEAVRPERTRKNPPATPGLAASYGTSLLGRNR